ncbi:MAG TPA: hypothetical protein VF981_09090 [Gemmatimonadaceae bacterium]|jgi:hypothetical protein
MRITFLALAAAVPIGLTAQSPATIRLANANAELAEEFSDLYAMREIQDGRVLLFDRKEDRFVVADFASSTVRTVSLKGHGPGEYEMMISALLPLGGDSTLAADLNRWLILVGDSVVATLPPDHPAKRSVRLWPLGADGAGRLLARQSKSGGGMRAADSALAVLVDLSSGRADTITGLRNGVRRAEVRQVTAPDGRVGVGIGRVPLNVSEFPLLFSDGWVAVARLDPYRVDWRAPDGRWIPGARLPFPNIRLNDRERSAYAELNRWARNATDWPEFLPPFDTPTQLFASPEGMLLIRRLPSVAQRETRYDVVDRTGALRGQLVLPTNQHIFGFGARSIYLVETDDDGIQRLHRHAWDYRSLRG